jgi:Fe-S cluster biogenesis protein NfuA
VTTTARNELNLQATGDRIEKLLDELRAGDDARSCALAEELLRLVTELYGAGLERVMAIARDEAPALVDRFVADDLVASLLIVHDLHPQDLVARVEQALESVRPFLGMHGGNVELVAVAPEAQAVRLRLLGSCDGCPSSAITLQHAVERAILEAAPEIVRIDVEEPAPEPVSIPVRLGVKPGGYESCPSEMAVG